MSSHHRFSKDISCLIDLADNKMIGFVDRGRIVDVIYL